MENRVKYKKMLFILLFVSIGIILSFIFINYIEYSNYTKNYNNKINSIVIKLKEEYPDITDDEIIEILNSEHDKDDKYLMRYGIDINKDSIITLNKKEYIKYTIINLIFIITCISIVLIIFNSYENKKEKDINNIIRYLEELNKKNYDLELDKYGEDELSILRDELYKSTVLLKEAADNSKKDKVNLKKSLEDISHQLKTPLTSIFILLDNILDNPDMDNNMRIEFLNDIKRELINMNFLVQSILKLSKLDSNTIKFIKEKVYVNDLVKESLSNVSVLCDLKNIDINLKLKDNVILLCDKKWQIEAISNIIKNCIDHSPDNSKIDIKIDDNNVCSSISIRDYGSGISKKDLPHIFERFYKGENAKKDSIGIGLALSKSIIEEDNGKIIVSSSNSGTEFKIKYFKV